MSTLYIGTSGFNYPYWKNRFYPEKMPVSKWLPYYCSQFNTLELNSTFYKFPVLKNLRKLADQTPDDFLFSIKAHKIITHTMRMRQAKNKVIEYMDIVLEGLGEKLGCVLFQLPPSYSFTEERLHDVLDSIEPLSRNVVEFRHVSWWTTEVQEALRAHNLSFCSVSYPGLPEDNIITSDRFYKRMHGVPELFKSRYDDKQLKKLAKEIPKAADSFVYFNNTTFEAGYQNALALKSFARPKGRTGTASNI